MRNVDVECPCGPHQFEKICSPDEEVLCPEHGLPCVQLWWQPSRKRERTVWSDCEAVVVFKKPDGTYSFPARASKPCPPGWTRIVARSDREIAKIEREAGVRHERRWYDSNGRGAEDELTSRSVR